MTAVEAVEAVWAVEAVEAPMVHESWCGRASAGLSSLSRECGRLKLTASWCVMATRPNMDLVVGAMALVKVMEGS